MERDTSPATVTVTDVGTLREGVEGFGVGCAAVLGLVALGCAVLALLAVGCGALVG